MAGCTTGAMAVAFAQPTDVVKVRFQAQVRVADGERRYNSTLDAYKTIARDEGVRGLWRGIAFSLNKLLPHIKKTPEMWTIFFLLGCMPNITRNAIVNCAELVTYDMIKELILKYDLMTGEWKNQSPDCHHLKNPNTQILVTGSNLCSVLPQTTCPATSQLPLVLASAQL